MCIRICFHRIFSDPLLFKNKYYQVPTNNRIRICYKNETTISIFFILDVLNAKYHHII